MLCQICNKNPASIHIQEIVNGKKQTLNLCLSCAGKKSLAHAMFDGMDLSDILQSLEQNLSDFGIGPAAGKTGKDKDEEHIVCPVCSWSDEQFRKTKRLGCPACYDTFSDELKTLLAKLHRGTTHAGKLPLNQPQPELFEREDEVIDSIAKRIRDEKNGRKELEMLEQDLKESVRREEYELAAELRDKIESIRRTLRHSQHENEDVRS